ncbi:MAG TPA: DUF3127 domain-containing protein [Paludibacteraceae bacterium]|nr:DUF3127 domain-containing protein [Paludibacteraceae bacterium]
MEISGRIIAVLPLQSGTSARGAWKKQEYVIEHELDSQYPKKMCFNLWGDNVDKFNIQEGQMLTVSFDVDCREYNGRWFNDIRAWRVTPQMQQAAAPEGAMPDFGGPVSGGVPFSASDAPAPAADASSDLPF